MLRAAMHDCLCCTREKDFLNSFPQVGTQAYICGIQIKVKRRMNKTRLPLRKVVSNCMGLDGDQGGDLGPILYLRLYCRSESPIQSWTIAWSVKKLDETILIFDFAQSVTYWWLRPRFDHVITCTWRITLIKHFISKKKYEHRLIHLTCVASSLNSCANYTMVDWHENLSDKHLSMTRISIEWIIFVHRETSQM